MHHCKDQKVIDNTHFGQTQGDESSFWDELNFRVLSEDKKSLVKDQTLTDKDLVLKVAYDRPAEDSDNFFVAWGNIKINYILRGGVALKGNKMYIMVNVKTTAHLNFEGGVSEGELYDKTLATTITIKVDQNGQIYFKGEPMSIIDNGAEFDTSTWSQIVSFGTFDECTKDVQKVCSDSIQKSVEHYKYNMENIMNDSSCWVFPATQTFTFSDTVFSNGKDLVVNLVYSDPM